MNMRFLDACWGKPVDRTPVWLMRQAGRYLPEYNATRARAGSFLGLAKNPDYACEVTLQPLDRFAHASVLDDMPENQFAFAPGIAGVDHAGDILALEQADQQFEAVFRAIQWAQCKSGRDHRQIGKGPFATFDFELLGHHELEQMPDRRGHQIRFALVIVAVAGESAQCASDVIRHRGLFCNDEFLAHWPG